ncbi:MAG TPA: FAD-dependent thymidylate synthase [Fimbriimonadaceae bacterium]|nr:FAD-dependent thymidylate synthase [Fimbriimonadaceae bacterium]
MARAVVAEAESLLDQEIRVLDKGFVRLVDYMGGDERIVQAARVSYGAGTKTVREDRGLINYLMKNWHTSPFEQVQLTFHTKMPIFVARQWVRHRTARLNEISGRYSIMRDEFYLPSPEDVCVQSENNKQGSGDALPFDTAMEVIRQFEEDQRLLYARYEKLLDKQVARELARINLPLSLYTEWYWQIDLHNLFHFIELRADAHAQKQIRVFAEALATCAKAVAPMAYEAFEEHRLHSVSLSRSECIELARMLDGKTGELKGRPLQAFQAKVARMRLYEPVEQPEEFKPQILG